MTHPTTPPPRRLARTPTAAVLAVAAAVLLAACGGAANDTAGTSTSSPAGSAAGEAPGSPSDGPTSSSATTSEAPSEAMGEGSAEGAATNGAATDLPDVRAVTADGDTITLADFAGEPVFVETFATWCSNCRRQLADTTAAATMAGDDATFLVLSIESDLDPSALSGYAAENGFEGMTFAVLDDASLVTLADTFGNAVLVPPSTPKFTVAADGSLGELVTGFESPDEILAQLDDLV